MARGPGASLPEGTVFVAVARGKQEAYLPLEHAIVPKGRLGGVDSSHLCAILAIPRPILATKPTGHLNASPRPTA